EGDLFSSYLDQVKARFSMVKVHNPKASRKSSSEVYVIAKNYYPKERLKESREKEE
ncbi:MAG: 23S rRNA (uridine(2552)-2'-O)-methyltransferase, partial [Thermoplasmata archaeon]|nr:23S rRNA (uridine(2552)-2'-O)-methyltransferase [Thermoplasmata archaeon]